MSAALQSDDPLAEQLRGFGPLGILAIVVILLADTIVKPLSAVLVLLWAWRSHTPWREIGYVRPRSWIGDLAIGIVFGCAFKLLMKAIVMPLLGADPINQPYHYLVGNTAALPAMLFLMIVGAGFGEETVFRGYLFERLGKVFGTARGAKVFDRADHVCAVRARTLRQSRYHRRRTGGVYRARLRFDLRCHRPALDADVGTCGFRRDGARDHLLGSREGGCAPRLPVTSRDHRPGIARRCDFTPCFFSANAVLMRAA